MNVSPWSVEIKIWPSFGSHELVYIPVAYKPDFVKHTSTPFAECKAYEVETRWVYGIRLDLSFLHERSSQDDVKMRFLREVHSMSGLCVSHSNWPGPDAGGNRVNGEPDEGRNEELT